MSNASQCHFLLLETEETERLPRWGRNNRDCDEPGIPGWVTFLVLLLGLLRLRLRPTGGRLGGGGNWGRVWVGEQPSNKCLRCPSLIHTLPRPPYKNECTHTHTHAHAHAQLHTKTHANTHTQRHPIHTLIARCYIHQRWRFCCCWKFSSQEKWWQHDCQANLP